MAGWSPIGGIEEIDREFIEERNLSPAFIEFDL